MGRLQDIDKISLARFSIYYALAIACVKVVGSFFTNSVSFLSEAIDSLVDVLGAIVSFFGIRKSTRPADEEHHFGHEKIEGFMGFFQTLVVVALYGYVIFQSILIVLEGGQPVSNSTVGIALLVGTVSVATFYSRFLISYGRKHNSIIIESQGLNYFGDNLKSIFVVVALLLSSLGFLLADPLIAIGVSLYIIKESISLAREGLKDILDENPLSTHQREQMHAIIKETMQCDYCRKLRLRSSGARLFVDIEVHYSNPEILGKYPGLAKQTQGDIAEAFPNFEVDFSPHFHPHFSDFGYIDKYLPENLTQIVLTKEFYKERLEELEEIAKQIKHSKNDLKKRWKKQKKSGDSHKKDKDKEKAKKNGKKKAKGKGKKKGKK